MALDNDAQGGKLFTARVPSGKSGSAEGLAKARREVAAMAMQLEFTAAAKVGDVRTVTCQLVDGGGNSVAEVADVELFLLDANGLQAAVANWTIADGGAGTIILGDEHPRSLAQTDATGALVVDVTDVLTSAATIYLFARVLNVVGVQTYVALSFA